MSASATQGGHNKQHSWCQPL